MERARPRAAPRPPGPGRSRVGDRAGPRGGRPVPAWPHGWVARCRRRGSRSAYGPCPRGGAVAGARRCGAGPAPDGRRGGGDGAQRHRRTRPADSPAREGHGCDRRSRRRRLLPRGRAGGRAALRRSRRGPARFAGRLEARLADRGARSRRRPGRTGRAAGDTRLVVHVPRQGLVDIRRLPGPELDGDGTRRIPLRRGRGGEALALPARSGLGFQGVSGVRLAAHVLRHDTRGPRAR